MNALFFRAIDDILQRLTISCFLKIILFLLSSIFQFWKYFWKSSVSIITTVTGMDSWNVVCERSKFITYDERTTLVSLETTTKLWNKLKCCTIFTICASTNAYEKENSSFYTFASDKNNYHIWFSKVPTSDKTGCGNKRWNIVTGTGNNESIIKSTNHYWTWP